MTLTKDQEFEFRLRAEKEAEAASQTPAAPTASPFDKIVGSTHGRFALGLASPLIGAAQGGAHLGDWLNKQMGVQPVVSPWIDKQLAALEAAKRRGMAAEGKEGMDVYGLAGSLAPSSLIASGVTKALPAATGLLGRMGLGAAQGATVASAQPVIGDQYAEEKARQTGAGAIIGGAVPAVTALGSKIYDIGRQAIQPFTETGRTEILQDLRNTLLGNNPQVKEKIIKALQQAQEIVPGSKPRSGEAMAHLPESTGLAAHEQDIARLPAVSPLFTQRTAEQEAARAAALQRIAKTPTDLEQAITKRAQEAAQNYGAAAQQIVTPDNTFKMLMERPSMTSIMKRAAELAKEKGDVFRIGKDIPERTVTSPIVTASGQPIIQNLPAETAKYPVQSLHYVKMAMDDLIKDPERFGIGANEARAIASTQNDFIKWLGTQSPAYNQAREAYKAASEPINRMQIGQELQKALATPLGTSERRGVFAKAAEEAPRTIKRATGQQMFDTLEEVLKPNEVKAVKAVADELARKDTFERLARGTKLSGTDAIPGEVGLPLPNLLYRPAMLTNFLMRHAGKKAEEEIAKTAAAQYLTPSLLAKSLKDVPARYRPMIDALLNQAPMAAATATARQFQEGR